MTDPDPAAVDVEATFLAAVRSGKVLCLRCQLCGEYNPAATIRGGATRRCSACGATTLEWTQVSGDGHLVSWTTASSSGRDLIAGIVELIEGPWLTARIDAHSGAARPGMPGTLIFVCDEVGETIPTFVPQAPDERDAPRTIGARQPIDPNGQTP